MNSPPLFLFNAAHGAARPYKKTASALRPGGLGVPELRLRRAPYSGESSTLSRISGPVSLRSRFFQGLYSQWSSS